MLPGGDTILLGEGGVASMFSHSQSLFPNIYKVLKWIVFLFTYMVLYVFLFLKFLMITSKKGPYFPMFLIKIVRTKVISFSAILKLLADSHQ